MYCKYGSYPQGYKGKHEHNEDTNRGYRRETNGTSRSENLNT